MADFGFIPLKPSVASGATISAQNLIVGSSAVSFSAFNSTSNIVAIQVFNGNVYCTLDGTTPTSANGGQLFSGNAYHWDVQTARRAKFLQTSGSAVLYAQECVSAGIASQLPDMAIWKAPPGTSANSGSTFNGITVNGHIVIGGTAPTPTVGNGAGSGASATMATGSTDLAGTVTVVTGTSPAANSRIVILTFASAYASGAFAVVCPSNNPGIGVAAWPSNVFAAASNTGIDIDTGSSTLTASTTYKFNYYAVGF